MSLKEKLTKAFRQEPEKSRSSNHSLLQHNAQLSLLYQLEQRKVKKLEEENRALLERIKNLTSNEDEARLKLLVTDRTKRKLVQLKAITKRTILSLESGIKEFNAFVKDVDDAIIEENKEGAMSTNQVHSGQKPDFCDPKYNPTLNRIAESPIVPDDSISNIEEKANAILLLSKQNFNLCGEKNKSVLEEIKNKDKNYFTPHNAGTKEGFEENEIERNSKSNHSDNSSNTTDESTIRIVSSQKSKLYSVKNVEMDSDNFVTPTAVPILNKSLNKKENLKKKLTCRKTIVKSSDDSELGSVFGDVETEKPSIIEINDTGDVSMISLKKEAIVKKFEKIDLTKNTFNKEDENKDNIDSMTLELSDSLNFEDALTGQFRFNGNGRKSLLKTVRSPSFIIINGSKMCPLHTSTPKQMAVTTGLAENETPTQRSNFFRPPLPPPQNKTPLVQKKKILSGTNVAECSLTSNDKKKTTNDCKNQNIAFESSINVTERRNTNYCIENDSTLAEDNSNLTEIAGNENDKKKSQTHVTERNRKSKSLTRRPAANYFNFEEKAFDNEDYDSDEPVESAAARAIAAAAKTNVATTSSALDIDLFIAPSSLKLLSNNKLVRKGNNVVEGEDTFSSQPKQKRRRRNAVANEEEISKARNDFLVGTTEKTDRKISGDSCSSDKVDQSTFSTTVGMTNMSMGSILSESTTSGRVKRAAATKVANYKPISISAKMRRDF